MKTNDSKQVAAFEKLLGQCNNFGAMFNPSRASIKVAALNTLLTSAQQSLEAVKNARNALTLAINERQDAINTLPKLGTRIINALKTTEAPASLIADANNIRMKFRYPVIGPKPADGEGVNSGTTIPPANTNRGPVSHLDFDSKIANVAALVQILASEPSYKPNEFDLQVETLNIFLTRLREKHKAVLTAQLALSAARLDRKRVLYDANGIYGTSLIVKKYVRSIFGTNSDQLRQIKGITFKK